MTKPRTGIPGVPGLGKVVNEASWGEATATKRYGYGTQIFPSPKSDACYPQKLGDKNNLQGPKYDNDVSEKSWLRGGKSVVIGKRS